MNPVEIKVITTYVVMRLEVSLGFDMYAKMLSTQWKAYLHCPFTIPLHISLISCLEHTKNVDINSKLKTQNGSIKMCKLFQSEEN